jgi:Tfp pilus assembly protein PilO
MLFKIVTIILGLSEVVLLYLDISTWNITPLVVHILVTVLLVIFLIVVILGITAWLKEKFNEIDPN